MALAVVFQIGSLGDTIVSLPSLLSLRELLPDCSDYVLVTGLQGDRKVHPSHVLDMAWPARVKLNYKVHGNVVARYASLIDVMAKLRFYRPRYGVYLLPADRTQQQVDRDKLFFRAAGVRELIGFRAVSEAEWQGDPAAPRKTTESFLRFQRLWNEKAGEKFDAYCQSPLLSPAEPTLSKIKGWLVGKRRHPGHDLVAICPFSNATSKNLDPTVVTALIRRLESELPVETILLGGNKDHAAMEQIRLAAGSGINACGLFSLEESAALFCQCALAVCVDSGPLHLAGAVGLPTVSAYAGINKPFHRWLPLGPDHTLLYQDVSCSGCGALRCPVEGHPCMSETTVDQLFVAIRAKLRGSPWPNSDAFGDTRVLQWPSALAPSAVMQAI